MSSVVQLCNVALSRLGNSGVIASLKDKSKEAALCNTLYAPCRDAVLTDFPWGFASKRAVLALLPEAASDWRYAYRYPVDGLHILQLMTADTGRFVHPEYHSDFEIGADESGTGKLILTDLEGAYAHYVARIEDVNQFDVLFRDALSWRLAAELAMPLSATPGLSQMAQQRYQAVLSTAATKNMNERHEPGEPLNAISQARLS